MSIVPSIKRTPTLLIILSAIYMFLSYFEIYLPGMAGPSTRYLIFVLSLLFLYSFHGKVNLTVPILCIVLWFVYKVISIAWSNQSNNDVSRTILSQLGMILLFVSLCGKQHDKKLLVVLVQTNYWSSFLFGLLTLIFHKSYISEKFVARQVLTLFGRQNDPNNCAVFLAIGIAIAAYSLLVYKKMRIFSIVLILVNSYGIMLTGSRMGLVILAVVALILFLLPDSSKTFEFKSFIQKTFILICVVAIGLWIINRFLPVASLSRLLAFDEYSEGSGRIEKWSYALSRVAERPFFGWGWGGYDFIGSVLHNTYLTILCDGGLVGLGLFVIPLFNVGFKHFKKRYLLGLLLLTVGLVAAFFLDAINKRFFWNTLMLSILLLENYELSDSVFDIWPDRSEFLQREADSIEEEQESSEDIDLKAPKHV